MHIYTLIATYFSDKRLFTQVRFFQTDFFPFNRSKIDDMLNGLIFSSYLNLLTNSVNKFSDILNLVPPPPPPLILG